MVLVLNQDYSPLSICSIQKAFLLVYLEKADLVEIEKGKKLRTISTSYSYPSVVKIKKYIHVPYKGVTLSRQNVFRRDNNQCQYCNSTKDLTIDHVIPKSKGGKTTWTNLVTSCGRCNTTKGNFSLEEANMTLRKKPLKPTYLSFLKMSRGTLKEEWSPYLGIK